MEASDTVTSRKAKFSGTRGPIVLHKCSHCGTEYRDFLEAHDCQEACGILVSRKGSKLQSI